MPFALTELTWALPIHTSTHCNGIRTEALPQFQSVGVAHLLEPVSKRASDGYVREAVDSVVALVYPADRCPSPVKCLGALFWAHQSVLCLSDSRNRQCKTRTTEQSRPVCLPASCLCPSLRSASACPPPWLHLGRPQRMPAAPCV